MYQARAINPLAALLALLGGGRRIGSGDVVPNTSLGTGVPSTFGMGTALPGLNYSPYAMGGSPYAGPSGSSITGSMSDPTGQALSNGIGASGLGTGDFLSGALFNQLFPSSAGALTPSAGPTTGMSSLFSMMPTSGEVGAATGGPSGSATPSASPGGPGGSPSVTGSPDISVGDAVAANAPATGPLGFGYAGPIGSSPFGTLASTILSVMAPTNLFGLGMTGLNQLGGFLSGLNASPLGGAKVNSPAFTAMLNTMTPEQVQMVLAQPATSPIADFTGGPAGQQAAVGGTFGSGMSAAPGQAGGRGGTGVEGVTGAIGPTAPLGGVPSNRSDAPPDAGPTTDTGPTGPTGPTGVTGPGPGTAGNPSGEEGGQSPGPAAGQSGVGTGDGSGGASGDSLLCNYALNGGACTDKEASTHRRNFGALAERAFREQPALKESFGHYQQASRGILDKIDTLDAPRRKAAIRDLGTNLVTPFAAAAKKGDALGAGRTLRAYTLQAAKRYGVTIPKAHLDLAAKHLGPLEEPTTA